MVITFLINILQPLTLASMACYRDIVIFFSFFYISSHLHWNMSALKGAITLSYSFSLSLSNSCTFMKFALYVQ
jgi:hypothetical protein